MLYVYENFTITLQKICRSMSKNIDDMKVL